MVEYRLSPLGHSLLAPMRALVRWADDQQEAILKSRVAYDRAMITDEALKRRRDSPR